MLLRILKLTSKKYIVLSSVRKTKTLFWCREEMKAVNEKSSI